MRFVSYLLLFFSLFALQAWKAGKTEWLKETHGQYVYYYTAEDKEQKKEYLKNIDHGSILIKNFFGTNFNNHFEVYVYPNRDSLDKIWQNEFKIPDFKSECWMVASGMATKMDMIAPFKWDKESCEHKYSDKVNMQRLITHELVHVFHAQKNTSPDFSNTENIDWFVEGLATYASGQFDSIRLHEVKEAIQTAKIPASLNDFWKGKLKYGISGSMVKYIDFEYGRAKLSSLLPHNKKEQILKELNCSEDQLLNNWKAFILKQK